MLTTLNNIIAILVGQISCILCSLFQASNKMQEQQIRQGILGTRLVGGRGGRHDTNDSMCLSSSHKCCKIGTFERCCITSTKSIICFILHGIASFRYYLQFAAAAAETKVNMHNLKIAHNAMNVISVLFIFTSHPRILKNPKC